MSSWKLVMQNAQYITDDLEPKSAEYIDSDGRRFIDSDDYLSEHKTKEGYVHIDDDSGLPIYHSEPIEECSDDRVKESWTSIGDRFNVNDVMNLHFEPEMDYEYKRVHFHDSVYLLYKYQVSSERAEQLRAQYLKTYRDSLSGLGTVSA